MGFSFSWKITPAWSALLPPTIERSLLPVKEWETPRHCSDGTMVPQTSLCQEAPFCRYMDNPVRSRMSFLSGSFLLCSLKSSKTTPCRTESDVVKPKLITVGLEPLILALSSRSIMPMFPYTFVVRFPAPIISPAWLSLAFMLIIPSSALRAKWDIFLCFSVRIVPPPPMVIVERAPACTPVPSVEILASPLMVILLPGWSLS